MIDHRVDQSFQNFVNTAAYLSRFTTPRLRLRRGSCPWL